MLQQERLSLHRREGLAHLRPQQWQQKSFRFENSRQLRNHRVEHDLKLWDEAQYAEASSRPRIDADLGDSDCHDHIKRSWTHSIPEPDQTFLVERGVRSFFHYL